MAATRLWEAQILAIYREVLAGEIALALGEHEKAIGHLSGPPHRVSIQ